MPRHLLLLGGLRHRHTSCSPKAMCPSAQLTRCSPLCPHAAAHGHKSAHFWSTHGDSVAFKALRRDGRNMDRKWRKAISYAINKSMRHDKSLPIHPAGFCFLEDLAWVLPVGRSQLHRTPTQLEIMQVISAEKVGRFEATCIFGYWPHVSATYSPAACRDTAGLLPKGLKTTPYTRSTRRPRRKLGRYSSITQTTNCSSPFWKAARSCQGAHENTNPCVHVSSPRVRHWRCPRQLYETGNKHRHRARRRCDASRPDSVVLKQRQRRALPSSNRHEVHHSS